MTIDFLFRIIFWLLLLIIVVFNRIIPLLHSKQNDEKMIPDKEAVKNEGRSTFTLRVVFGLLFFAILLAYSIYPSFMNYLHIEYPLWIRWIGVILAFIGTIFWIYSQLVLGRYWSPQLQIQNKHKIIAEGPYKYIRHPIYSAMMVWAIGVGLFAANIVFILFVLSFIIFFIARVPKEEKMMVETFGEAYIQYSNNTGKYLPKIVKGR